MKALRLVLLAIVCLVVFGLGWRLVHPDLSLERRAGPVVLPAAPPAPVQTAPAPSTTPQTAESARAQVLSRMADAPIYGGFFDRLRSEFPSIYLDLVDDAAQTVAGGAHVPNPDRLLVDGMRRLRQSRGIMAAEAEAGPLAGMFQAQSAVIDALSADSPALCADFLYGGSSPEFMAFVAKHRDLIAHLALSNLDAVSSGKAHHVRRAMPESEDFDLLSQTLTDRGFSTDEIAAVLDGKVFNPPLPEARLCSAGSAYLHALEAAPEDLRLRVYALSATLLARS